MSARSSHTTVIGRDCFRKALREASGSPVVKKGRHVNVHFDANRVIGRSVSSRLPVPFPARDSEAGQHNARGHWHHLREFVADTAEAEATTPDAAARVPLRIVAAVEGRIDETMDATFASPAAVSGDLAVATLAHATSMGLEDPAARLKEQQPRSTDPHSLTRQCLAALDQALDQVTLSLAAPPPSLDAMALLQELFRDPSTRCCAATADFLDLGPPPDQGVAPSAGGGRRRRSRGPGAGTARRQARHLSRHHRWQRGVLIAGPHAPAMPGMCWETSGRCRAWPRRMTILPWVQHYPPHGHSRDRTRSRSLRRRDGTETSAGAPWDVSGCGGTEPSRISVRAAGARRSSCDGSGAGGRMPFSIDRNVGGLQPYECGLTSMWPVYAVEGKVAAMDHPTNPLPNLSPRTILFARLGIGLGQGLALHALSRLVVDKVPHPWVSANPVGFGLLVLLATLLPWPVLLGLGHARLRVLAGWTVAAALLIFLLGGYDLRQAGELTMTPASDGLMASLGAILFLGQALVMAADAGRCPWPRYADCFEAAWRVGLQLMLAGCFVLGFWLIYWIGTELFRGVGLDVLHRLGGRLGFVLTLSTVGGALGIHLADAGWRLTLGLRNLLLGLKAWLTPVLAGLVGTFILALPFAEMQTEWWRAVGPGWLIAAAAGLVTLISAVHGDGRDTASALPLLRLSARLATPMLPVLLVLAAWALSGQINAQGITQERVAGFAAVAVLSVHVVAYPLAALRPGMRLLEPANMGAALLAVGVLAALNSPLANPARLEVQSQTSRLLGGAV
ncbi:MAG: DUF4153 domain-containing protein, partial [Acetobacteraceae bacterium]